MRELNVKKEIRDIIEKPSYEHFGGVVLDEITAPKRVASICAPHPQPSSILYSIGSAFANAENAVLDLLKPDEHKHPQGIQ